MGGAEEPRVHHELALGLSFPICEWGCSEDLVREAGVHTCLETHAWLCWGGWGWGLL